MPFEGNRLGHVIDDMQFNRLEETDRRGETTRKMNATLEVISLMEYVVLM